MSENLSHTQTHRTDSHAMTNTHTHHHRGPCDKHEQESVNISSFFLGSKLFPRTPYTPSTVSTHMLCPNQHSVPKTPRLTNSLYTSHKRVMSSAAELLLLLLLLIGGGGDGGDRGDGGDGWWGDLLLRVRCAAAVAAMRCCCCCNAGAAYLPRVTFAIPTQTQPCRLTRKRLHRCSSPSEKQALVPVVRRCIIRRVFGKRF